RDFLAGSQTRGYSNLGIRSPANFDRTESEHTSLFHIDGWLAVRVLQSFAGYHNTFALFGDEYICARGEIGNHSWIPALNRDANGNIPYVVILAPAADRKCGNPIHLALERESWKRVEGQIGLLADPDEFGFYLIDCGFNLHARQIYDLGERLSWRHLIT